MQSVGAEGMGVFLLTKLNEQNYLTWSVKAEMLLRREDLWKIVSNPPAVLNKEQTKQNEKVLTTIIMCLEDSQLIHMRALTSARQCWQVLHHVYKRSCSDMEIIQSKT